jgi:diacylglycerol kinase family enzyme
MLDKPRNAVLIVNPTAGRVGLFRRGDDLVRSLAENGYTHRVVETTADADSARNLAISAAANSDLVIACGGDGTVHGVLQGVAHTSAVLGVLPFGTANALARNLGLAPDPVVALRQLLTFDPRSISLGVVETPKERRWFTVMAGCGPDGRLVQEMAATSKAKMGRNAYYAEAARLFLTRRFPAFRVEYRLNGSTSWSGREVVAMMASRVPSLGGIFSGLTTDSRLHHPHLLVQLLSAPAHLSFPAWFAFARAGFSSRNPWLTTLEVSELRCLPLAATDVLAQVDGEAIGRIPMSLRVEVDALRILMPAGYQRSP